MRQPNLFLIRPPPLPGESLSSWRQRSAWSNGYTLFPVIDERIRRVDADLGLHDADLDWVAAGHNLSVQEVIALTFRSQIGMIVGHLASRSQPAWWLRSRQGNEKRPFGPMFCPVCLGSDATPYFRLQWRYGFITRCVIHGCLLLDQCPACMHPPWPGATGVVNRLISSFDSLKCCWHCGLDLSTLTGVACDEDTSALFVNGLAHGSMQCGAEELPTGDVLHALRGICQLFLRNRARNKILQSTTPWAVFVEGMRETAKAASSVDYLCVADRQYLLKGAWKILAGWPNSFIEFAEQTGVSRAHFNGTQELQPAWMNRTIGEKLALQNRTVTSEVIAKTIDELASQGHAPVTKAAVRKRLDWSGDRGLDVHFQKRTHATDAEHVSFCEACMAEIHQTAGTKRRHRHALIDIAVMLTCIFERCTISEGCELSVRELAATLCQYASSVSMGFSMTALVHEVVDGLRPMSPIFHVTKKAQPRQVRKRLLQLMSRLGKDLIRDVLVFRS